GAGRNISPPCWAPLIVTFLNRMVAGLHSRLGAITASSDVKPSLLLVSAVANAVSAALPRGPMIRSIWATSLPSPTSDSPTHSPLIFAIAISFQGKHFLPRRPDGLRRRHNIYPCCQRPALFAGPVSQIAAKLRPACKAEPRPAAQSQPLLRS